MKRKKELLPSAIFSTISPQAAERLCRRSMDSSSRFAFEVAKHQGPAFFAAHAFDASLHADSLAEHAMACGRLSLARLFFRQRRLSGLGESPVSFSSWLAAMESNRLDSDILRSRAWCRHGQAQSGDLYEEATWAFSMGRPMAGLFICGELADKFPDDIEAMTRRQPAAASEALAMIVGRERVADTFPMGEPTGPVNFSDWSSCLSSAGRATAKGKPQAPGDIASTSLVEHLCAWASIFKSRAERNSSAPWLLAAAGSLERMAQRLWLQGAHASPEGYGMLFCKLPLTRQSPQITFLAKQSEYFQLRFLAPAWVKACAAASAPCGDGILWDKFHEAHAELRLKISPNPFALLPGSQSPSAWSLHGDMSLALLGASRGFAPADSSFFIASPALCAKILIDPAHAAPSLSHEIVPGKHGDLLLGQAGAWCSSEGISRQPSASGGRPAIRASLSSMAAALGHFDACKALVAAGCAAPSTEPLFANARRFLDKNPALDTPGSRLRLAELQSGCEAFILSTAVAPSTEPKNAPSTRRRLGA